MSSDRVTIRQIAEMSEVSVSTVSNVLNGRTLRMSAETLERVRGVISTLRYRPSSIARGLVTGRTATIGLVVAEIETALFFSAVGALETAARAAGYNLIVCHARGSRDEAEVVTVLRTKGVDGIIFIANSEAVDNTHLTDLPAAGILAVVVNRRRPGPEFGRVTWNDRAGVAGAVEHLHDLGHRRIAFLRGPRSRDSTRERAAGYRRGLKKVGLPYQEDYVRLADYTADPLTWERATSELLDLEPAPSAIIASDDSVAAVVIRTSQRRGLSVPRDLAVVGIDDQMFATLLNPPLTTIRLPVKEAAERALEMLVDAIAGQSMREVRLATELVVRDSSSPEPRTNVSSPDACIRQGRRTVQSWKE
ncbi:LacI family DNA-binding transcriptional regulator [Kribbella sp. NPDC050241]|uniref:LacI family DNA-binding transcriptional regulator n=1 Tax=Kribbella sp. NPDC050241 TaxID=3364115 RepID=UPI00379B9921